jgi:hypothetical protein
MTGLKNEKDKRFYLSDHVILKSCNPVKQSCGGAYVGSRGLFA